MEIKKFTFYQRNMSCNDCLTNVVNAISSLKYILGFDIDLKTKKITLIYESGHYEKQTLRQIINSAITPESSLCPVLT